MSERLLIARSIVRDSCGAHPASGFYERTGKRIFDCAAAGLGLVLLAPLLAIVAICVKLSSRGAVFFRQTRVGQNGGTFTILKFRSMAGSNACFDQGSSITAAGDARITRVGQIIRAYKLDELPQLWNVLRGDMSLVGPRPELPEYVLLYSPEQLRVLAVRPGITDLASLVYRDEERMLAAQSAPEDFYVRTILPDKLQRNLEYIGAISFIGDLKLIFETLAAVIMPASDRL
jgi:lipopolysaccharide/colanic/teichoic acid biosynthesis glycosyltransferase